MLFVATNLFAASVKFIKIERLITKPPQSVAVFSYSINLASFPGSYKQSDIQYSQNIKSDFIYLTKVSVDNKIYYRLVTGNFKNQQQAGLALTRIKKYYPGAWINIRTKPERQLLTRLLTAGKKRQSGQKKARSKIVQKSKLSPSSNSVDQLLNRAKQEFLDSDYTGVIAITSKIFGIGTTEQTQLAMELAGIAHERLNKFAQAIAIYSDFLDLYPDSEMAPKIVARLDGLKTMDLEPRSRIDPVKRRSGHSKWNTYGAVSQYYQDNVIQSEIDDTQIKRLSLVTDVDLFATRKTDASSLIMRFDGGIFQALEEGENDTRIGHALVSYTNSKSGYQLTGGRQRGAAKGVFGRFDGLVYKGLSHRSYNYSIYLGSPVQSSYDNVQTDRQFVGTNVHFSPFSRFEMDIYLLQQNVSELTDRQAFGTEFEYRRGRNFLFGIIDYDLFYGNLNNFTLIGSYPYSEKLELNLSYDFRNSPTLTTSNALVGQTVESIEELKGLFTDEEIYQLAEDRTSKGQNFNIASNYQVDDSHQLYLSLSYAFIEATIASGGVAETAATDDLYLTVDYSIHGYFSDDDYTSFGLRISDTVSTSVVSLRARTLLPRSGKLRYDSRLRLDYRQEHDSDAVQWILNPSVKMTYRPGRALKLEASLGLEYSSSDLRELEDQTAYTLSLGYIYQF